MRSTILIALMVLFGGLINAQDPNKEYLDIPIDGSTIPSAYYRSNITKTIIQTNNNSDSIPEIRGDVNTNTTNITSNDADILINSTQQRDSIGDFNVKSSYGGVPGAIGDSITDDTDAFKSCFAAAGRNGVYFPPGKYSLYDSITVTDFVNVSGAGQDASQIISQINRPVFNITLPSIDYGLSMKWENFTIIGSNKTDSSNQHGMIINDVFSMGIDNVGFYLLGGRGVWLGRNGIAASIKFEDCLFKENNGSGGIYGKFNATNEVNGIDIINCEFYNNYQHGIDLVGRNVNMFFNSIEFNDSCGIHLVASEIGTGTSCRGANTTIQGNWIEKNLGGEIYTEVYWDGGSVYQDHTNLKIVGNFIQESESYTKPEATALVTLNETTGSSTFVGYTDLVFRDNYMHADSEGYFDGNDLLYNDAELDFPEVASFSTKFVNLGEAAVGYKGVMNPGRSYQGTLTAATGITEAMFAPLIYYEPGADIDITADKQIADGLFNTQTIGIVNASGTYTLTLDDGAGLALSGQFIMGAYDYIELMWISNLNIWLQASRSVN